MNWIATDERMPESYTDVWIKLVTGFLPGLAVWDSEQELWCGYSGNYHAKLVGFWMPRYDGDLDDLPKLLYPRTTARRKQE